jgi:lysophospholipase L1-like esterase
MLVCLETGLRLTELAPTKTLAFPDEQMWRRNPGPFAPNQDFVDLFRPSLPHRIHINSLGFRGREFAAEKPPGTYRILCLGDSYTFGDYVNDDETFPADLERKLREMKAGRPIDVVNAGVNGYTITDEAGLAEEKGFSLGPDAIVVAFVLNDLADLTRKVSSRENQRLEATTLSTSPLTPLKNVLRNTATYNLLFVIKATVLGRLRLDPTVQDLPIRHLLSPPFDARTEELFAQYGAVLSRLNGEAKARGCDLTLVLFPFYEQVVGGAPAEAQARMTSLAAGMGIRVVDLLPAFLRFGPKAAKLFLMPLDHHPSATGHRVAAREVSRALAGQIAVR